MKLEIFLDSDRKARIRLRARNGKILMSSEAYSSKSKARKTAMVIYKLFWMNRYTPIVDLTVKK